MAELKLSTRAYCKIMLHCAKYPHCAINGVLLAENKSKEKKGKGLYIVDAIPLFHICLHVSPMAEIALTQIDSMASSEGLVIAGYYTANETLDDMSIEKPATRIAEKIAENFPTACLLVVDNRKVTVTMDDVALKAMASVDGRWKSLDSQNFTVEESSLEVAASLIQNDNVDSLVDFDNHLDDLSLSWRNEELNKRIESLIGESLDRN